MKEVLVSMVALLLLTTIDVEAQSRTTIHTESQHTIARLTRSRQTPIHKFAENGNVGSTEEDIWSAGGNYTGWLQADSLIRIAAGGSANDTANGTGCRAVVIEGVDGGWEFNIDTLATAGASASAFTDETFSRINRAYCQRTGTYGGMPDQNITIETGGGTVVAVIDSTAGQARMSMYSVPKDHVFLLEKLYFVVNSSNRADINMYRRDDANITTAPFGAVRSFHEALDVTGPVETLFDGNAYFEEYTDIWCSATRTQGSAARVACDYIGWLVRE